MAVELAVGYVSLVADTSRIPGQIDRAIQSGGRNAAAAGTSIGQRMSSGIGSALKAGAAAAATVAGGVIGTALTKGWGRLTAIDDAQGKLRGLGHDAASIAAIMDSALASVKGTAFGLGEAATIAASAVAAGVKPGEQLTNYLKLTADAATIAGASLADMGSIVNKVTTSGKAYTDDLMMLSDRGIPIFTWLQEEYGVSADALSKMVKEGKVDAATYRKVIAENIGGAALESGSTIRGAWANLQAGLGRVGEAALKPFQDMMKGSMASATDWADAVAPKVEKVASHVAAGLMDLGRAFQTHGGSIEGTASLYESFGVKARVVYDKLAGFGSRVKEGIEAFRAADGSIGERVSAFWQKLTGGVGPAGERLRDLTREGSGLRDTMSKLGSAAVDVGRSLVSLTGDTGTVAAAGLRVIGSSMRFLADHSDKAGIAIAGVLGAMAVGKITRIAFEWSRVATAIMTPAVIASTIAQTRAISQHNEAIRAYLAARGIEIAQQPTTIRARVAEAAARTREAIATRAAATALGQYAVAQRAAALQSGVLVAAMRNTAASAASVGARVQGTAVTALSGLRSAAGSVAGLLGGPLGIALAGAGVAIMGHMGAADQAKRVHETLANAVVTGAKAQNEFVQAVSEANGALDSNAMSAATKVVEANLARITEVGREGHHWWDSFRNSLIGDNELVGDVPGLSGLQDWITGEKAYDATQRAIEQNRVLQGVLQDLKLEVSDLGPIVAAGGADYDELIARLENTGGAGADVVQILRDTRRELQSSTDAVRNSTDGFAPLTEAIRTLADESANADDRLSAMNQALDALSGEPIALDDAMQSFNEQLRDLGDLKKNWDEAAGVGGELINPDTGGINTAVENGGELRDALSDLRDQIADVALAGGDLNPVFAELDTQLAELAPTTGLSVDQLRDLAETVGLVPENIRVLASVEGADKVVQDLTAIKLMLDRDRDQQSVEFDTKLVGGPEVIAALEDADAKVQEVAGKPGVFRVEAPNIQQVIDTIDTLIRKQLPDKVQRIRVVGLAGGEATLSIPERARPQAIPGRLPENASGGTITGPGTGTSDNILGIDRATGIPTSWVSPGEEVIRKRSADKWRGLLKMINRDDPALSRLLPAFAEGGTVPTGVSRALSKLRAVTGNVYEWAAEGPTNFDCSGLVGWVQQILMGIANPTERLYTTYSLLGGTTAGLVRGLGPSGTYFRVGVNQEHMSATLAGQPLEAGGSHGTSRIGAPAVGHDDPQYTAHFYLPNNLIEGIGRPGVGAAKDEEGWTDADQLKLDEAYLDVDEAKDNRRKVYDDPESTDIDRRRADMRVRQAEQSVVDLEEERDEKANAVVDDHVPEAPPLERRYSEEESEVERAKIAADKAKRERDEVYADPESTEEEIRQADLDYSDALNARDDALKTSDKESLSGSIAERIKQFGADLFGQAVDSARDALPFSLGRSRWLDIDIPDFENHEAHPESLLGQARARSFPKDEVDRQMPVTTGGDLTELTPYAGVASLPHHLAEALKRITVFDDGGWLEPGQLGINLSKRPEPIFNSPTQLARFSEGLLQPPAPVSGADFSVNIQNAHFSDGMAGARQLTRVQDKRSMQHAGRPFR